MGRRANINLIKENMTNEEIEIMISPENTEYIVSVLKKLREAENKLTDEHISTLIKSSNDADFNEQNTTSLIVELFKEKNFKLSKANIEVLKSKDENIIGTCNALPYDIIINKEKGYFDYLKETVSLYDLNKMKEKLLVPGLEEILKKAIESQTSRPNIIIANPHFPVSHYLK